MDPLLDQNDEIVNEEGALNATVAQQVDEKFATSDASATESVAVPSLSHTGERQYPSLYDSYGTTLIAIVLAVVIVSSVVGVVTYIYRKAKSDHAALTQFVTTMFALIAGVFIADKLIAGPSTELLNEQEALKVLEFIQQTCLMVFAYYFGTKAQPPQDGPPNAD